MPNSRFPFQRSHTSLTHPSLLTEWHMSFIIWAPARQQGGEGSPVPKDAVSSSSPYSTVWLAEKALLIWREGEGGERRGRGEGRREPEPASWMAVGVCGVAGSRLAEARKRGYVLSYYLLNHTVQPLILSYSPFPIFLFFFSFCFFPPFNPGKEGKKKYRLTGIIQASPACEGWYKWISGLLASDDSNVRYWRWMFLKKRLMVDAGLRVPFIILNII